jgi:hypothetical protein
MTSWCFIKILVPMRLPRSGPFRGIAGQEDDETKIFLVKYYFSPGFFHKIFCNYYSKE